MCLKESLDSSLLSTFGSLPTGYPLPVAMPAVAAVHTIRYVKTISEARQQCAFYFC